MRLRVLVAVLGLTALLTACGSDGDDSSADAGSEPGETSAAETQHNDADVAFVQMMIPHHEQAIEMAMLAADRAEDERVIDLAARIQAAQGPEIDEMRGWLEDLGEDEASSDEHGGGHDGGGFMTDEDMDALGATVGTEFDRTFLEMMIEHHRGAVEEADVEIADCENPDAVELARVIKSAQEAEIAEMEALLEELAA
ncbi:MAG: DUF305 domain-containing protein [Acidimicrobiales bacterium]